MSCGSDYFTILILYPTLGSESWKVPKQVKVISTQEKEKMNAVLHKQIRFWLLHRNFSPLIFSCMHIKWRHSWPPRRKHLRQPVTSRGFPFTASFLCHGTPRLHLKSLAPPALLMLALVTLNFTLLAEDKGRALEDNSGTPELALGESYEERRVRLRKFCAEHGEEVANISRVAQAYSWILWIYPYNFTYCLIPKVRERHWGCLEEAQCTPNKRRSQCSADTADAPIIQHQGKGRGYTLAVCRVRLYFRAPVGLGCSRSGGVGPRTSSKLLRHTVGIWCFWCYRDSKTTSIWPYSS